MKLFKKEHYERVFAKADDNAHYAGKLRIFVSKLSNTPNMYDSFEIIRYESFDDRLISDVGPTDTREILKEEIHNAGVDIFDDDITDILMGYEEGDMVEIVADSYLKYTSYQGMEGMEYDAEGWFKNAKHRKLTEDQVERFWED